MAVGEWLAPPTISGSSASEPARRSASITAPSRGRPASRWARWRPGSGAPDQLRAALIGADQSGIAQGVVFDPARASRSSDTDEGRSLVAILDASPFSPPAPPIPRSATRR